MTDSSNAIFEPDVVINADLFAARSGPSTPERALLLAALEDAGRCMFKSCIATDDRGRALYEETRDWFASTEHARLFDFESVCGVLGIEADWLRERVFARCERLRAAVPPAPDFSDRDADLELEPLSA